MTPLTRPWSSQNWSEQPLEREQWYVVNPTPETPHVLNGRNRAPLPSLLHGSTGSAVCIGPDPSWLSGLHCMKTPKSSQLDTQSSIVGYTSPAPRWLRMTGRCGTLIHGCFPQISSSLTSENQAWMLLVWGSSLSRDALTRHLVICFGSLSSFRSRQSWYRPGRSFDGPIGPSFASNWRSANSVHGRKLRSFERMQPCIEYA
jgi:hypothetical protein